jgi:hypothetical protein
MALAPCDRFRLDVPTDAAAPTSALLFDGRKVAEVAGRRIEYQGERPGAFFLVLVTYDSPYEESLELVLLSPAAAVLDRKSLGAPYSPGLLTGIEPQGEDGLAFRFPDDRRWLVRALPKRRLLGGSTLGLELTQLGA